jgi:hypothetical protein
MSRRAAALAAFALAACSQTTELFPLPSTSRVGYCPVTIDVYGADDTLPSECGVRTAEAASPAGYFRPGEPAYEATLAGRLRTALMADPALGTRFGQGWRVRACGGPGAYLSSLAPQAASDCAEGAPPIAPGVADACSDAPGSVAIVVASEPLDRCHGGGVDGVGSDDPDGYADHFAARLSALVAARAPSLLFVGPQTAWTPLPSAQASTADACGWKRGDWGVVGVARFLSARTPRADVVFVADLHDEFQHHSLRCCAPLGHPCTRPEWLVAQPTTTPPSPSPVNCSGAGEIAALWIEVVRSRLAATRFACEP